MLVQTARPRRSSGEQVQAVVHLVSSSVEDMDRRPGHRRRLDRPGAVRRRRRRHRGAGDARAPGDAASTRTRPASSAAGHARPGRRPRPRRGQGRPPTLDFDETTVDREQYVTYPNGTPPLSESTTTENYTRRRRHPGRRRPRPGQHRGADAAPPPAATAHLRQGVRRPQQRRRHERPRQRKAAPGARQRLTVSVVLDQPSAGGVNDAAAAAARHPAAGVDPTRGDRSRSQHALRHHGRGRGRRRSSRPPPQAKQRSRRCSALVKIAAGIVLVAPGRCVIGVRRSRKEQRDAARPAASSPARPRTTPAALEAARAADGRDVGQPGAGAAGARRPTPWPSRTGEARERDRRAGRASSPTRSPRCCAAGSRTGGR